MDAASCRQSGRHGRGAFSLGSEAIRHFRPSVIYFRLFFLKSVVYFRSLIEHREKSVQRDRAISRIASATAPRPEFAHTHRTSLRHH
jgi:hypothetical protein